MVLELVSFGGKNYFKTRPQNRILVSLTGVLFKISDEQPLICVWSPPPGGGVMLTLFPIR